MKSHFDRIVIRSYGVARTGASVDVVTLRNSIGAEVDVIGYGAAVAAIRVPDRDGRLGDVALGYDTLSQWEDGKAYFGCVAGRLANRLARGRFSLEGRTYQVPTNDGRNALHGGNAGFDKRVWAAEPVGACGVAFTYTSPDGEQGFPGELTARVIYAWDDDGNLSIDYYATTTAATVCNLTNHTYFNLAGEGRGAILDHVLRIDAERFTAIDAESIPTGELLPVEKTPMDFRRPTRIGERIDAPFPALVEAIGYDHNYVLNGEGFREVAEVFESGSGRVLTVSTSEPGVQFYAGNHLGKEVGKGGCRYPHRGGLCLETQHFPDSPNHPHFPGTILLPGEVFRSKTTYRFSTRG